MNVLAHTTEELFLRKKISLFILVDPFADLGMPHQAVSTHFDTILTTEIGNTVSTREVELTLPRLRRLRLHVILSCHAIKLATDKCLLIWVRYVALVYSYANGKIAFVGIFQALCLNSHAAHEEQDGENC